MRIFTTKLASRLPRFFFLFLLLFPLLACRSLSITALRFHHRHHAIILLTGFEPFGRNKVNSSWEAVRQLDGTDIGDDHIVAVLLPVTWRQAGKMMRDAIDRYRPIAVINVGQGNWRGVELVTGAFNTVGHIPDNEGFRPTETYISEHGAFSFTTTVRIDDILKLLTDAKIEARTGKTSGNYLCNFVNYHSYEHLARVAPQTLTVFIHVPGIATTTTDDDQKKIKQLVEALQIISRAVAGMIETNK